MDSLVRMAPEGQAGYKGAQSSVLSGDVLRPQAVFSDRPQQMLMLLCGEEWLKSLIVAVKNVICVLQQSR